MTEVGDSEDFEFLGGSLNELAMKMGDIEKILEEINNEEKRSTDKEKKSSDDEYDEYDNPTRFQDSCLSVISDTEVITDDAPDGFLAKMQEELREADEQQEKGRYPIITDNGKEVSVTVKKSTKESPVGISMKTSKGVTRIVTIVEGGLLMNTPLRGGLRLMEINGVGVQNAKHARQLIQEAESIVTITAHDLSVEV
jgi:hypothetical protein